LMMNIKVFEPLAIVNSITLSSNLGDGLETTSGIKSPNM
jgi:hypothetical protein